MSKHPEKKTKLVTAAIALSSLAASGQIQLTVDQIVRAWESAEFRQTLTEDQLAQLPENPAGELQFKLPLNGEKSFEIASTQNIGCATQNIGCATQNIGCATQNIGCATQNIGCSTQFESCMA